MLRSVHAPSSAANNSSNPGSSAAGNPSSATALSASTLSAEAVDNIPVNEHDVRMIILSFLIHNCHTESAKALLKGMGVDYESLMEEGGAASSAPGSSPGKPAAKQQSDKERLLALLQERMSMSDDAYAKVRGADADEAADMPMSTPAASSTKRRSTESESEKGGRKSQRGASHDDEETSGDNGDGDTDEGGEGERKAKKRSGARKAPATSGPTPMATDARRDDETEDASSEDPRVDMFALSHLPAFKSMKERKALYEKVLAGHIKEAFQDCQTLFPGLFDVTEKDKLSRELLRVLFLIQSQQFLEHVRNKEEAEAFAVLQNDLGFFAFIDQSSYLDQLQDLAPLLAYDDPTASPMGHLLMPDRRELVASALNSAILAYLKVPMHDALGNIARQLTVVWETLAKEKGLLSRNRAWSLAEFMKEKSTNLSQVCAVFTQPAEKTSRFR